MTTHTLKPLKLGFAILTLSLMGCGTPQPYQQVHVIPHLTITYMDKESIQRRFTKTTNMSSVLETNVLQGYYDYTTNTLFCPIDQDATCGHELKHAVLGDFHH